MSPQIMNEVFKLRNTPHYNLRHTSLFSTEVIHSVFNGRESASYLGPKIWILLMVLRMKLKSGYLQTVRVEFVRLLYLL